MDGVLSTFIILLLTSLLGLTIYLLFFKDKKDNSNSGTLNKNAENTINNYELNYNDKSAGATYGDTALFVKISDIHTKQYSEGTIYYDNNLQAGIVSIGRAESNNYFIKSRYIDNDSAFYLAKYGSDFKIKANEKSRNGFSYQYQGERINQTVTFNKSVTLYMGPVKFVFSVPGFEQESRTNRDEIFSDESSDINRTKIFH